MEITWYMISTIYLVGVPDGRLHQGSSIFVTHKGLEPFCRTFNPRGSATLVWSVVPNPCLPADFDIVDSAFQLVLIPELFALDAPIVLSQVLQLFEKRITLLDT